MSRSLNVFPIAVCPEPSAPWHIAHLLLNVSAPLWASEHVENITEKARTASPAFRTVFILSLLGIWRGLRPRHRMNNARLVPYPSPDTFIRRRRVFEPAQPY